AEGLPFFYLRDIPPVAAGGPEIREPRIYYGEETDSYVIVSGSTPEFDYPKGTDNGYAATDGTGGVLAGGDDRRIPLGSSLPRDSAATPLRRLLQRCEPAVRELHHRREPGYDPSQRPGTGEHNRPVPAPRPRPLSGDPRRAVVLDAGRLYDERLFSVCTVRAG